MAVIRNLIEAEMVPPPTRQELIDLERLISPWSQANQAGNDEIAEGRVIVILAAFFTSFRFIPGAVLPTFQPRPREPISGEGIKVFVNPGDSPPIVQMQTM